MEGISILARVTLAAVFALAGVTKLADRAGSIKSLGEFGLPPVLARPFALLLPLLELTCAVALIPAQTASSGAMGVLALLALFIGGISINLARGRTPDCHCFGQLHSEPIGWATLARNVVLAGVAAFIVWQGAEAPSPGIVSWVRSSTGTASPIDGRRVDRRGTF